MSVARSKKSVAPSKKYSKVVGSIWLAFIAGLLGFALFVFAVSINFLNLFGELPDFKTLENPQSEVASEMYSADGVLMGKYYRENRSPVKYQDLPQNLVDALIATEDVRFEEHSGIDFKGLLAVGYYGLTGRSRGASTLTQQVAKNLFRTRAGTSREGLLADIPGLRMLIIKTKEWIVAIRLEKAYTKKEILEMYLNTVEFGSNAYGIKSAAKTFFSKAPKDLALEESALLVGIVNAPSRFSPISQKERSQKRRDWVLSQMQKYGFIDEPAYSAAVAKDIKLQFQIENQNTGIAPYLRAEAGKWLLKWARDNGHDLYAGGLKIYTTIDSRMQQHAEESVREHMKTMQKLFFDYWKKRKPWVDENGKTIQGFLETAIKRTERYTSLNNRYEGNKDSINYYLNKKIPMKVFTWEASGEKEVVMSPMDSLAYYKHFLHTGFIAVNPLDGNIKAWVGGTDYKYFKYDHVKQGRRQPGSTFKPVVYTAAIDRGYSPCYKVPDIPVTFPAEGGRPAYTAKNSDNKYTGRNYTLREALANSVNTVTMFLVKNLTPDLVVKYAERLGLGSNIEAVPSVGLGISDVSVYEMAGAYGTFVNKGTWTEPIYITRIEDKNGNTLFTNVPRSREVLSEETAYLMIHMLQGAVDIRLATAWHGLRNRYKLKNEIGAKTGTTQNFSDAWFMGVTPDLVCGMWVGGEDRSIHFQSANYGQGNKLAMPIYGLFMQKVYADKNLSVSKAPFPKPEQPLTVEIDCSKYNNSVISDTVSQDQILLTPAKPDIEEEI
ncbi:penicillin-binding protein 1A [Adhaeribacter rhizoryzae]|uniref:Penicillin-binding protein n=1 Tax=Adhaeribacter rhizoryzae TaxID=2607907 RepID=A0A5M6DDU6_9BACT|nr:transglycosylase domain-containing protein [Adhaeribacter rhizoryzae]KAA5545668.1 penicillin-binding protein [Adhaeribacter rhizoryzae]